MSIYKLFFVFFLYHAINLNFYLKNSYPNSVLDFVSFFLFFLTVILYLNYFSYIKYGFMLTILRYTLFSDVCVIF